MPLVAFTILVLALALGLSPAASARSAEVDGALSERVAQRIAMTVPGAIATEGPDGRQARVDAPARDVTIVVDAHAGLVVLSGHAPNVGVVREAIEAARHVGGVRAVRNEIDLPRTAARTDPYGTFPYGYPYAAFPDVWRAGEPEPMENRR